MECKNCKAQLEEGVTLCPGCGTDNTPAEAVPETPAPETAPEAAAAEAAAPEIKPGITLTPGKLVALIVGVVLLTAVVVALILQGMGFSFTGSEEPQETVPTQAVVEATGDTSLVTCKSNYTVTDEEVIENMATIVATLGDETLTNAQLQIYYWLEVQNFLANYGSYASYFGLDYTQPMDAQVCSLDGAGNSWQQYFLSAALSDWQNYAALAQEAKVNGYTLDEEYTTAIDALPESLTTDAGLQGFASAEEYLAYNVGAGAAISDYQDYMRTYYQGYMYFQSQYDAMVPTDEELEEYYYAHEEDYVAGGLAMDTYYVDVRHILVLPEGATVDTIYTETFSEEAWNVGEVNANEILNEYLAGEMTEEAFAALANQYSEDPGSNTNGGLYEDVYEGQMVEEFEAWCFDPERQVGDYGIVRTSLGFHIMYFSGSRTVWQDQVMSDLLNERGTAMIAGITEKYPMTVDFSKIMLGNVNLGA